jgi:type I restriction enzyme S subunit
MNPEQLLQHFDRISEAQDAIPSLRRFILDLAVRGKLVEQDPNDESAAELLKRVQAEKALLMVKRRIRPNKDIEYSESADEAYSPNGWCWVHIDDIAIIQGGKRLPAGAGFSKEKTPHIYIRVTDMKDGTIRTDNLQYITSDIQKVISQYTIDKEDLYITIAGTIGQIGRVPPALDGQNLTENAAKIVFREIDPDFLYLVLSADAVQEQFRDKTKQMAQPKLALKRIAGARFPLPPLAEQHRIVVKVDELMAMCDQLQAAQTEREQSRDRLVAASLNKLNQSEQSRRPGMDCRDPDFRDESNAKPTTPAAILTKQPTEIAEAPPGYLPVNWVPAIPAGTTGFDDVRFVLENLPRLTTRPVHIKQLRQTILNLAVHGKLVLQAPNDEAAAELLNRIRVELDASLNEKKQKKGEQLPKVDLDQAPFDLPIGWAWARFTELGVFGRGKSKHRPRNDSSLFENGRHLLVQTGDVARSNGVIESYTNKYNDVGLAQSFKWPAGTMCITIAANIADSGILSFDACFPDSVVGFIPASVFPNARYFEYFVRTAKANLLEFAPATAQKNINLEILNSVLIPLPPLAEQHRIVAKVDELMALCDQLETQLTTTATDSRRLLEAVLHEALLPATAQAA